MFYEYRCACGWTVTLNRRVSERDDLVVHPGCTAEPPCQRIFSRGMTIVTGQLQYQDHWRNTMDATDTLAMMRRSEKEVEKSWEPTDVREELHQLEQSTRAYERSQGIEAPSEGLLVDA